MADVVRRSRTGISKRDMLWQHGLTAEQITAVKSIQESFASGSPWSLYREPTIGDPQYVELRCYFGRLMHRWVLGKDGTVTRRATTGKSSSERVGRLAA
jgi:hypothetical protein